MMQHNEPEARPQPRADRGRKRKLPATAVWRTVGVILPLVVLSSGCNIGPRNFRGMTHPAAINRARSVTLGRGLPESQVIPPLIGRLDDPDPVVRLTAHQELRHRSGQDFGYLPWASPEERAPAVKKYREWWEHRRAGLTQTVRRPRIR